MKTLNMHGDVLIHQITEFPPGLTPISKRSVGHISRPDFILAEGEVTGHAHRIACEDGEVEMFEKAGTLYMKVNKAVTISHEEHVTKPVEPGLYEIGIQREWDYIGQMERQIAD